MKFGVCGIFLVLISVVGVDSVDISDIKQFYNNLQKIRQCRYDEVQQCLYQTFVEFSCTFKDIRIRMKSENRFQATLLTKSSLNLLSESYTPRNARMDIFFTPNDRSFVATEELPRFLVGDEKALQKTCFVQETRKCFHEAECGIPFHTYYTQQVFDLGERPFSQLYNAAAHYVKEKWQQFKEFLFGN